MSQIFAKNLRTYRLMAKMAQIDLAKSAGISRAAVANYEMGRTEPNFEILCKFSDALGVDLKDLLIEHSVYPDNIRRVQVTDEESALLQAFREADPIYQNVALDILRQHKKVEQ